jgi:hypothetical protein
MVLYLVSKSAPEEGKSRLPSHPEVVHWGEFIANEVSISTSFFTNLSQEMYGDKAFRPPLLLLECGSKISIPVDSLLRQSRKVTPITLPID